MAVSFATINRWETGSSHSPQLLKLTKSNDAEDSLNISYIDNSIPQEKKEGEIEEENFSDDNASIFSLYSVSNNQYTDNRHKDDSPTGTTKINYKYGV